MFSPSIVYLYFYRLQLSPFPSPWKAYDDALYRVAQMICPAPNRYEQLTQDGNVQALFQRPQIEFNKVNN